MVAHYSIRVLKVIHYGDYLTELTVKSGKTAFISYLSLIKGYSHMILHLFPLDKSVINEAIDFSRSFKDVKCVETIKGPGIQPFLYIVKRNYGVLRAIAKVKALKVGPVIVENGVKLFPIMIPNGMESKLIRLVKKYSPTRVRVSITKPSYLKHLELPLLSYPHYITFLNLTEYEFQVLKEAYESGYFDWPKRTNLDKLAKSLGLSKTTVLEHIRKAERKILKYFLEYIAEPSPYEKRNIKKAQ